MGDKVEKFKLSQEQLSFAKNYRKIKELSEMLQMGIQYKASELEQLQNVASGVNLRLKRALAQAPTELTELVDQPDPESLVINY